MNTTLFCNAIKADIAAAFPSAFVGAQVGDESVTLPAILIDLQGDSPVYPLFKGQLGVTVCSQADDTTAEDHADFVDSVVSAILEMTPTGTGFTFNGVAAASTSTQRSERHWQTSLVFSVGFTVS